jgi:hypothetical protein
MTYNVLESKIHISIASYLRYVIKPPSRWHTVEVSNQQAGRAGMFKQITLKKKGSVTGWPDICIYWQNPDKFENVKLIFLEVKMEGGKLTEKQAELHKELKEEGHSVFVVHSVSEVEVVLKDLGAL